MKLNFFYFAALPLFSSCGGKHADYDSKKTTLGPTQLDAKFSSIKAQIIQPKCLGCHSPGGSGAVVPLDKLEDILHSSRELILVGNPDESGLVIAVERQDSRKMPPPSSGIKALTLEENLLLRKWIKEGAAP